MNNFSVSTLKAVSNNTTIAKYCTNTQLYCSMSTESFD